MQPKNLYLEKVALTIGAAVAAIVGQVENAQRAGAEGAVEAARDATVAALEHVVKVRNSHGSAQGPVAAAVASAATVASGVVDGQDGRAAEGLREAAGSSGQKMLIHGRENRRVKSEPPEAASVNLVEVGEADGRAKRTAATDKWSQAATAIVVEQVDRQEGSSSAANDGSWGEEWGRGSNWGPEDGRCRR